MALADTTSAFRRFIHRYIRSDRGNMTMIAGLAAIPIVASAGMAIDYARISRVKDKMQLVIDGAALAAVGAKNLSGTTSQKATARVAIAESYLANGFESLTDARLVGSPTVTAVGTGVTIRATAEVKGSFMNVLNGLASSAEVGDGGGGAQAGAGGRKYGVTVSTSASFKSGASYLCILALNNSDPQSLEIQGTADIFAPGCAVWVNSGSSSGLYQNGNATLTAEKICVHGNYYGSNYFPYIPKTGLTDCPRIPDPLRTTFLADYAATYSSAALRYNGYSSSSKKYSQMTFTGSSTVVNLEPGLYDGGIQVKAGATVRLKGGTYFIQNGKFEVQNATVQNYSDDEGVTIVLTEPTAGTKVTNGTQVRLDVQAQGVFHIKAPAAGRFAGIAVAQHPNSITTATKTAANTVIGGGTKSVTGILYFPSNFLYITGGGTGTMTNPEKISVDDPLFAIVADKVLIEGNGQLRMGGAANYEDAGLPALPTAGTGKTTVALK